MDFEIELTTFCLTSNVFLGLALGKQNKYDEAATAYTEATNAKRNEALAWQGLIDLYEKQGGRHVDAYRGAAVELAQVYMEAYARFRPIARGGG